MSTIIEGLAILTAPVWIAAAVAAVIRAGWCLVAMGLAIAERLERRQPYVHHS